jgi:hypothetical protein
LDSTGSGEGPLAGNCEYGNEPSNYIKSGQFHDQLNDSQLLKKLDNASVNETYYYRRVYPKVSGLTT